MHLYIDNFTHTDRTQNKQSRRRTRLPSAHLCCGGPDGRAKCDILVMRQFNRPSPLETMFE